MGNTGDTFTTGPPPMHICLDTMCASRGHVPLGSVPWNPLGPWPNGIPATPPTPTGSWWSYEALVELLNAARAAERAMVIAELAELVRQTAEELAQENG
jgi:hypothetical protein